MITEKSLETILRNLIETDTSNPPGTNYQEICQIIKEQLERVGCKATILRAPANRVKDLVVEAEGVSGERVSLVATLKKDDGKALVLNGHTDVVPAGEKWKHPPFKLTRAGDYWYGRGVADMKGGLAGMIRVIQELSSEERWRGTLILEAVCDEEIGGHTGTAYLHEAGLVKGDYCIVGDGSINYVINAANGCLRFRVFLKGISIHSSMNWRGINAIERAGHLIIELENYNRVLHQRKSEFPANPETGVDFITPSITVGTIRGGTKVNTVPDECVLEIDRRVSPEEDKATAIAEFREILENLRTKDKDFNYRLVVGGFHDSFEIPADIEPISTLRESYRQLTGRSCPVYGGLGCYDAAYIAKSGVPVAVFGVSRIESNVHGIDECAKIKDIVNFAEITKATALKLLQE